jgi:hypothetical protein
LYSLAQYLSLRFFFLHKNCFTCLKYISNVNKNIPIQSYISFYDYPKKSRTVLDTVLEVLVTVHYETFACRMTIFHYLHSKLTVIGFLCYIKVFICLNKHFELSQEEEKISKSQKKAFKETA